MRRSPPDEGARIFPILFRSLHLPLENREARSLNRLWRANQAAELCPCCAGPAKRRGVVNGAHRRYLDVDHVPVGDYNQGMTDARYGWLDTQFHLNTLPRAQFFLWPALAEFKLDFVLYGGTAIALRLAHRESVDFDFFSTRHFQPGELRARAPLLHATETLQASPDTLVVLKPGASGDVKLSFFGGLDLARVMPPVENPDNGLRVASLLDLAGTKVKAVQDRAELKDYLDLAALLRHGLGLFDALRAAMTIFGNSFNPLVSLKALVYFEDGDVRGLGDGERRLLETQAAHVDLTRLTPFSLERIPLDAKAGQNHKPA